MIRPLMQSDGIPGMAVGVVADGRNQISVFGVMDKATGKPVTEDTLFEIGSLSKTFTATLVALAQAEGSLSLADAVSQDEPALRGSGLDGVSLLNLGTHTSGGMPLQMPDDVTDDDQAMRYFQDWKPAFAPGTVRTYANPSIGLLGRIAAERLNGRFDTLMQRKVFDGLGLRHTHLHVTAEDIGQYAQGYTKADAPIRMTPGVFASEAYGVRSTIGDMLRFVGANMGLVPIDDSLQAALTATHTGYYALGAMTQDLIWEQYRYPTALTDLLAGNGPKVSYEPNAVVRIDPPTPPREDVLINKTGSTNGFAAYAAFVPAKKLGIVLLANKNIPIEARVTAADTILSRITGDAEAK